MKKVETQVESSLVFTGLWIVFVSLIMGALAILAEFPLLFKLLIGGVLLLIVWWGNKDLTKGIVCIKNTGKELVIEWVKKPKLTLLKERSIPLGSIEGCVHTRNQRYEILRILLESGEVIRITSSDSHRAKSAMGALAKKYGKGK